MKLSSSAMTFAISAGLIFFAGVGCSSSDRASNPAYPDRSTAADRPSTTAATLSSTDRDFAVKAAQGGMAEVALGNLAQQQGYSMKVKDYGKKLATDHAKANNELMQIASREGISLPTSMDSRQQSTIDKFSKLSGAKFDQAFLKDSVKDHKDDIAEFQKEANQGTDPALKDFASSHVSTLQDHLDTALDAQKNAK